MQITRHIWYKNNLSKKIGFTLAEVLITLVIIGIIAAFTIPSLITNLQDQQYKVAWKKNYNFFSQATNKLLLDKGRGDFINLFADDTAFQSEYEPFFNVMKSYPAWGGWHSANTWYFFNGTSINSTMSNVSYLADGSMLAFDLIRSACDEVKGNMTNICGEVYFDVNGLKKPNTIGKDIFSVYVRSNSIIPRGSYLDFQWVQISCVSTGQGFGCSNKYLLQ